MYSPPTPAQSAACGRPARHGPEFRLRDPGTWPAPAVAAVTETTRYGNAEARSWHGLHQQLARQRQWKDHPGQLPVIEGTLIRLEAGRLPGDRSPEPLWLWSSRPEAGAEEAAPTWQAFLRPLRAQVMSTLTISLSPSAAAVTSSMRMRSSSLLSARVVVGADHTAGRSAARARIASRSAVVRAAGSAR